MIPSKPKKGALFIPRLLLGLVEAPLLRFAGAGEAPWVWVGYGFLSRKTRQNPAP